MYSFSHLYHTLIKKKKTFKKVKKKNNYFHLE